MELSIEQALHQGVAAHNSGNLQEAKLIYQAILQSDPKHPDANHNLGLVAISVNKTELALPLLKISVEQFPNIEDDNYILFLCNNEKKINFCLKDLESRFNSVLSTSINDPDDQIVDVLINKFFSDNQVLISIEVIKYLSGRIERSYKELYKTLEKINNVSLKNKQKITIPFLRQYFFN